MKKKLTDAMASIFMAIICTGLGSSSPCVAGEPSIPPSRKALDPPVEDIYVLRSWRESRVAPTGYCAQAKTGFASTENEDRYTFRSTSTRASDGLMVNADVRVVGRIHACFGPTSDPTVRSFYAEGSLGSLVFTGRGECRTGKADFPEQGMTAARCFLELVGLAPEYVGGQLTTNSVLSRNVIGGKSNPPGYTQPSIATIRLWRRRGGGHAPQGAVNGAR